MLEAPGLHSTNHDETRDRVSMSSEVVSVPAAQCCLPPQPRFEPVYPMGLNFEAKLLQGREPGPSQNRAAAATYLYNCERGSASLCHLWYSALIITSWDVWDLDAFLLGGTEIWISHVPGKGESPFLKEADYAEGHFRFTRSEEKWEVTWVHPTRWADWENPESWLLFPRILAVFCITQSFYCYWIAAIVTKFLLLFWDTSTRADKRLLLDLTMLQKYSFHYLLSSLKLPVEGTMRRLWSSCGSSLSGRHESTGQCKPQIINTRWALANIYKSQRETAGSISETFGTFQAVCKMSPSHSPAPHPPKLQSHVIRVTPNRLWRKTILFFI